MPVYEYQCLDCQETYQERHSFAEADVMTTCPSCESERTRKILSQFMVLTGSPSMSTPSPAEMRAGSCACGGHCGCSH